MANQSPQNRPNGNNNNNDNRNGDRRRFSILTILIIAVAVTLLFNSLLSNVFSAGEKQVTYDAFLSAVETDAISQVEIQSDRIQFLRRDEMALSKSQRTVYYTGLLPNVDLTSLISTLEDNQVEFSGEIVENSTFTFLFSWVLFPLLMLALLSLLMRFIISRSGGGAGGFQNDENVALLHGLTGLNLDIQNGAGHRSLDLSACTGRSGSGGGSCGGSCGRSGGAHLRGSSHFFDLDLIEGAVDVHTILFHTSCSPFSICFYSFLTERMRIADASVPLASAMAAETAARNSARLGMLLS